jgi:hypothetical protein
MPVMSLIANPWQRMRREEPYVLPEGRAAVNRWNDLLGSGDPRRIEFHILPEPFLGLLDAPVLVPMANPGSTF